MTRTFTLAAALGLAAASFAHAGDAAAPLTSDTIVEHFIASAKLGEARKICIGTAQECERKRNAPLEPLDMRVQFEYESAELTPTGARTLSAFAAALNDPRLEIATFKVEGHTDAHGDDAFNDDLSRRRAATVTQRLVALGVSPDRIEAVGYGESRPLGADGYAPENRRVEARMILPRD